MVKKILLALAATAAALTLFWAYIGGFASPTPINRVDAGPFDIAYIRQVGAYKTIGKAFDKLEAELQQAGITGYRVGGIFYDRPETAGNDKCRSDAFAILTAEQLKKLQGHAVLKTRRIERREYLASSFPYRGMLSVIAGVTKVYPQFSDYWKTNKLPEYVYRETDFENDYGIEIYGPQKIFYYMTIPKKQ